jgi:hypothetical protein
LQLRRRLRSGFAASLTYTYSKSIDDDAYLGGAGPRRRAVRAGAVGEPVDAQSAAVAQNWLDPRAERSLSSFDQRQLLSVQGNTPAGRDWKAGTLLGGWRGRALKEWTVQSNLSYGSGLPETPLYPAAVPGTGIHRDHPARPDRRIDLQLGRAPAPERGAYCVCSACSRAVGHGGQRFDNRPGSTHADSQRWRAPSVRAENCISTWP